MKTVVITGGSGFIGTLLVKELVSLGYSVRILDTKPPYYTDAAVSFFSGNTETPLDPSIFKDVYGIINLAGVPIFGRFTKSYKDILYDSRVITTKHIIEAISLLDAKPAVLVSASAVGYYGDTKGEIVTEEYLHGNDFLAHVCIDWEQEAQKAASLGIRTVILRTAYVIGDGGILRTLIPLFKKWIGGYFGTGIQYMPWISATDLVSLYIQSLENNSFSGAYNTAVENISQKEFMRTISACVSSPITWSIPVWIARILYLDFADALVSHTGTDNTKLHNTAFIYKDTSLKETIKKYIHI